MQDRVAIGILLVGIGTSRQHQTVTLFLSETRREAQRVFSPIDVTGKRQRMID